MNPHPTARTSTEIPAAPGHWLLGNLVERRERPLPFFVNMSRLAPMTAFRMLWVRVYTLNHPDFVKHVLIDNVQNYHKGRIALVLRPLLGNGLLLSEGDTWKRNRRLAQPAFHRHVLAKLTDGMVAATEQMLARWAARPATGSGGFDIVPDMMSVTMSIVARALFSTDVAAHASDVSRALTLVLDESNRRALSVTPWMPRLPTQRQRAFDEAIRTLDDVVFRIIRDRRGHEAAHADLLSMLMTAKDADTGESLSDVELRDEAMTMFLAGHETTANALSWLWLVLSQNYEVEQRLREEFATVLGGRTARADDLPKLKYTTRVLEETMRLYPPAWLTVRQPYEEDQIGPYRIAKDALLGICPYAIHRLPEFWPDPERFDPDRFLPENVQKRPKLAYMPFGAGQRMCIGNNLAMMEAAIIVSTVLQRYRIEVLPGQRIEAEAAVTLRPRHGLRVRATPLP